VTWFVGNTTHVRREVATEGAREKLGETKFEVYRESPNQLVVSSLFHRAGPQLVPLYIFYTIKTVKGLWQEWTVGLPNKPSITALDSK
jgi:hypothetical protein